MVFYRSEGGELMPWCPEVVLYIIQPESNRVLVFIMKATIRSSGHFKNLRMSISCKNLHFLEIKDHIKVYLLIGGLVVGVM